MAVTELWVSGAAAIPERYGPEFLRNLNDVQWTDQRGIVTGFESAFAIRNSWPGGARHMNHNWFHFALPTPALIGEVRQRLTEVVILWSVSSGTVVREVTAHHAAGPAGRVVCDPVSGGMGQGGDHRAVPDGVNTYRPRGGAIVVSQAVQLCLLVETTDPHVGHVILRGAAGRFQA